MAGKRAPIRQVTVYCTPEDTSKGKVASVVFERWTSPECGDLRQKWMRMSEQQVKRLSQRMNRVHGSGSFRPFTAGVGWVWERR